MLISLGNKKMKIIAHRGNLVGPNPKMENHPDYLNDAILRGFEIEVDLWRDGGKWALGHDKPGYEVSGAYLNSLSNMNVCWIHIKNIEALSFLVERDSELKDPQWNYFWHESDDHTLTSKGEIWSAKGKYIKNGITVFLGEPLEEPLNAMGVCTDYALKWRNIA
jgi:hypothetical protein